MSIRVKSYKSLVGLVAVLTVVSFLVPAGTAGTVACMIVGFSWGLIWPMLEVR